MICNHCRTWIDLDPHGELWVFGRDWKPYHTRCLRLARDDEEAAEIGIAGGQGRSAGEVLRAGEGALLAIVGMFGVAGLYGLWRLAAWIIEK